MPGRGVRMKYSLPKLPGSGLEGLGMRRCNQSLVGLGTGLLHPLRALRPLHAGVSPGPPAPTQRSLLGCATLSTQPYKIPREIPRGAPGAEACGVRAALALLCLSPSRATRAAPKAPKASARRLFALSQNPQPFKAAPH